LDSSDGQYSIGDGSCWTPARSLIDAWRASLDGNGDRTDYDRALHILKRRTTVAESVSRLHHWLAPHLSAVSLVVSLDSPTTDLKALQVAELLRELTARIYVDRPECASILKELKELGHLTERLGMNGVLGDLLEVVEKKQKAVRGLVPVDAGKYTWRRPCYLNGLRFLEKLAKDRPCLDKANKDEYDSWMTDLCDGLVKLSTAVKDLEDAITAALERKSAGQ